MTCGNILLLNEYEQSIDQLDCKTSLARLLDFGDPNLNYLPYGQNNENCKAMVLYHRGFHPLSPDTLWYCRLEGGTSIRSAEAVIRGFPSCN